MAARRRRPGKPSRVASTSRPGPTARRRGTAAAIENQEAPPAQPPRGGSFPVVALGASAGGLHALEEFFSSLPAQSGMAFVVVTHQAVGRTSLLPELLARCAHVPVVEALPGMQVEPDRVYVAPPGSRLRIHGGRFETIRDAGGVSPPLPIDTFLRSLAEDRKHSAFCIILSGTGTDGTLGLQAIKGESGLVVAQDPASAEFPGMPTSAIATGVVDFVLPVAEMPARLIAYARGPFLRGVESPPAPAPAERTTLKQILALLNARTGGDFSGYKVNTLRRRVERRMALHQLHRMDDYLAWAQKDPGELQALFKELLIGVTSFFRDPNAWKAVSAALQSMLAARPDPSRAST